MKCDYIQDFNCLVVGFICQYDTGHPGSFKIMMTSSNGGIFRDTGPFLGESTGQRRMPLTKAIDAGL